MEDQGVLNHQTFWRKISLSSTAVKTRRSVNFQVSFDYGSQIKAASCTFIKKNDGNVQHYFEDEFDFWNDW